MESETRVWKNRISQKYTKTYGLPKNASKDAMGPIRIKVQNTKLGCHILPLKVAPSLMSFEGKLWQPKLEWRQLFLVITISGSESALQIPGLNDANLRRSGVMFARSRSLTRSLSSSDRRHARKAGDASA